MKVLNPFTAETVIFCQTQNLLEISNTVASCLPLKLLWQTSVDWRQSRCLSFTRFEKVFGIYICLVKTRKIAQIMCINRNIHSLKLTE